MKKIFTTLLKSLYLTIKSATLIMLRGLSLVFLCLWLAIGVSYSYLVTYKKHPSRKALKRINKWLQSLETPYAQVKFLKTPAT